MVMWPVVLIPEARVPIVCARARAHARTRTHTQRAAQKEERETLCGAKTLSLSTVHSYYGSWILV
jgi:hypothetical protein